VLAKTEVLHSKNHWDPDNCWSVSI